jgi:hypothetical protein
MSIGPRGFEAHRTWQVTRSYPPDVIKSSPFLLEWIPFAITSTTRTWTFIPIYSICLHDPLPQGKFPFLSILSSKCNSLSLAFWLSHSPYLSRALRPHPLWKSAGTPLRLISKAPTRPLSFQSKLLLECPHPFLTMQVSSINLLLLSS